MMMMMMMMVGTRCCVSVGSVVLVLFCARVTQCGLVHGEQVAFVRVTVQQEPGSSLLQGRVLQGQQQQQQTTEEEHELRGDLRLIKDEHESVRSSDHRGDDEGQRSKPWIGVVPVQMEESPVSNSNQESFASTVVNK
ncbi:RING finger protein 215 isoform X1, partial [Tachysurus ichikawai]